MPALSLSSRLVLSPPPFLLYQFEGLKSRLFFAPALSLICNGQENQEGWNCREICEEEGCGYLGMQSHLFPLLLIQMSLTRRGLKLILKNYPSRLILPHIYLICTLLLPVLWSISGSWKSSLIVISSTTNRLITSKDHASMQINLGHLDERGIYTGAFSTFAL
ncbi:hypothetical protein ACS0TY_015516 [Phlomoides rotata]